VVASFEQLELKKVRKVFGRHAALAGVSARFSAGEVSLLMGPNGAGKSTLLAILSTNSEPTSGEVRFGELDHKQATRQVSQRIGLLSHAPLLYPELSPRENLLFFARIYGRQDAKAWVESWLEQVVLTHAAERPVRLLSHGMKQRVALGRALLHDPDLLLLDEPFTGLDRAGVELLRGEIARARRQNRIVIVVTHDVDAVDGLCDQLVVLRRGRVVEQRRQADLGAKEILDAYHAVV
jgi:heme exporter protein A